MAKKRTSQFEYVCRLIASVFPDDVLRTVTATRKGNIAAVYEATLEKKKDIIVKLFEDRSRSKLSRIQKRVILACKKKGIPAPVLFSAGSEYIPYTYMIFQKAEGMSADEFEGNRIRIWEQIGRFAKAINSIRASRYGRVWYWRQSTRLWRSWSSFVSDELARHRESMQKIRLRQEDAELLERALKKCSQIAQWKFVPRVIHGDLALKNVIVHADGTIACIVDWDEMLFARAPHQELCSTLPWLEPDEEKAFLRGYGISEQKWDSMRAEVELLELLKFVEYFIYFKKAGDAGRENEMRERMRALAD